MFFLMYIKVFYSVSQQSSSVSCVSICILIVKLKLSACWTGKKFVSSTSTAVEETALSTPLQQEYNRSESYLY